MLHFTSQSVILLLAICQAFSATLYFNGREHNEVTNNKKTKLTEVDIQELNYVYKSPPDSQRMISYARTKLNISNAQHGFGAHPVLECDACKVIVFTVQNLLRLNASEAKMAVIVTDVCIGLNLQDEIVCTGIVKEFKDEVLTVVDELALSPSEVCGLVIGETCGKTYDPYGLWNVTLPDVPKPPVPELKLPEPGQPTMRILHLSDIHIDLQYIPGSSAQCGEPLCCRNRSIPLNGSEGAGFWGDYRNCDLPTWTLHNMFEHLRTNEKFDAIYWTGDLPGHMVWMETRQEAIMLMEQLADLFKKYFGSTPVYSAFGNHEGVPVNSFPPSYIKGNKSVSWLYNTAVRVWGLPRSTNYDLSRGGFYTVMIRPGLRLISINSNYCNKENWWMLLNMTDPMSELSWLAHTLQAAEDQHQKVHIISHIPPGWPDCLQAWSWNYYRIVARYEGTITGQFYGHTHHDHFELFYDPDSGFQRPVSVAYITPSVTTFQGLNPGYRVFTVDGEHENSSWQVLDHETYVMNLTEANKNNVTNWTKEYSAKETYNMASLFPSDWDKLWHTFNSSLSSIQDFYRFYYKLNPPQAQCDRNCARGKLCQLKSGRSHDPHLCDGINSFNQEASSNAYTENMRWTKENRKC